MLASQKRKKPGVGKFEYNSTVSFTTFMVLEKLVFLSVKARDDTVLVDWHCKLGTRVSMEIRVGGI